MMEERSIDKLAEMVKCPCWDCDPRGFDVACIEAYKKANPKKDEKFTLGGGRQWGHRDVWSPRCIHEKT